MELVLPKNYSTMSNDEIMYIDGGLRKENTWYGARIYYTYSEAKREIATLDRIAIGAGVVGSGLGLFSLGLAAFGASVIVGYASLLSSSLNSHLTSKGVILNTTHAAVFWSEGR